MIKLISPQNNEIVTLVRDDVKEFCDAYFAQQKEIENDYIFNGINWGKNSNFIPREFNKDINNNFIFKPVTFSFSINNSSIFILSLDKNFNEIVLKSKIKANVFKVHNLLRNQIYYWKIVDLKTKEESEIFCFKTGDYPRALKVDYIFNVRDFGGYNTKFNKRIKQNLLFRGCELVTKKYVVKGNLEKNQQTQVHSKLLYKNGLKVLRNDFRIGAEIDLRSFEEANKIKKSVLSTLWKKVDYFEQWTYSYDDIFLENDEFKEWMKKIFEIISYADRKPVYIHCWGGADRTGTICFLLGALLGMSYTDLVIEYELVSFNNNERSHSDLSPKYEWQRFPQMIEKFAQYAKINNLSMNFSEIVEHFLKNKYGITGETINRIKKIFLFD